MSKFRKRKRKLSSCVRSSSTKREIRRFHVVRSRATTAKKCTKKSDARAKLLFCQSKPIAFLPFLLPSLSSLLKLPNMNLREGHFSASSHEPGWRRPISPWVSMRNFSPVSEMKKGRGYWLAGTASSGAKFGKLSKYDETQSYNFCAYPSFGNSCSFITAVKWDAYDVENTAGEERRYRIDSKNSSLFHLGDNNNNVRKPVSHSLLYLLCFLAGRERAMGNIAFPAKVS